LAYWDADGQKTRTRFMGSEIPPGWQDRQSSLYGGSKQGGIIAWFHQEKQSDTTG
jgi:hypothetical protein